MIVWQKNLKLVNMDRVLKLVQAFKDRIMTDYKYSLKPLNLLLQPFYKYMYDKLILWPL